MPTDPSQQLFKLRPDVVLTELDKGGVLLDLATKYFYSVNPSGWALTQLFEGGATAQAALDRANMWSANGAGDDVKAFIERLVSENLVATDDDDVFETDVTFNGQWASPTIEKHKEPLQRVMVSAFDPTLPLAE